MKSKSMKVKCIKENQSPIESFLEPCMLSKNLKEETLKMRNKTRNHKSRSKSIKQRPKPIGLGSKTSIENELLKKSPKRSNYVNNYEDYKT